MTLKPLEEIRAVVAKVGHACLAQSFSKILLGPARHGPRRIFSKLFAGSGPWIRKRSLIAAVTNAEKSKKYSVSLHVIILD